MFVISSCSYLCPIHWSHLLSREWRYSLSSTVTTVTFFPVTFFPTCPLLLSFLLLYSYCYPKELLLSFLLLFFLLAHCYFLSCYFIHTATQKNCYFLSCYFFSYLPHCYFLSCYFLSYLSTVTFFPVTFFPVTFFPTWNCYFLSCYLFSCYFLSVHRSDYIWVINNKVVASQGASYIKGLTVALLQCGGHFELLYWYNLPLFPVISTLLKIGCQYVQLTPRHLGDGVMIL